MKIPKATSPSPISSGCCRLRVFALRFFFLVRAGMRGLSARFFRRLAIARVLRRRARDPFALRALSADVQAELAREQIVLLVDPGPLRVELLDQRAVVQLYAQGTRIDKQSDTLAR